MEETIFLIGPRASGKTTLAEHLAHRFGWIALDTDQWILSHLGKSVQEIVATEGWEGFRQEEAKALRQVTRPHALIATGGGMILLDENRLFMRDSGIVLYLKADVSRLCERLLLNPQEEQRPSLTGAGLVEEVESVLKEREQFYQETAHYVLDANQGISELVDTAERILLEQR